MKEKNLLFSNSDYIFAYFFSMGDGFARNSLAFFPAHKKFFFPRRFYLALLQLGWFRLLPLKGLLFCLCELFWAVFNPIENWNSTERRKKSKQVNKRRNWATSRFAQLIRQRASCVLWRKCTVLARTDCCSYRCLCCASMELFHVEIPPWKFSACDEENFSPEEEIFREFRIFETYIAHVFTRHAFIWWILASLCVRCFRCVNAEENHTNHCCRLAFHSATTLLLQGSSWIFIFHEFSSASYYQIIIYCVRYSRPSQFVSLKWKASINLIVTDSSLPEDVISGGRAYW